MPGLKTIYPQTYRALTRDWSYRRRRRLSPSSLHCHSMLSLQPLHLVEVHRLRQLPLPKGLGHLRLCRPASLPQMPLRPLIQFRPTQTPISVPPSQKQQLLSLSCYSSCLLSPSNQLLSPILPPGTPRRSRTAQTPYQLQIHRFGIQPRRQLSISMLSHTKRRTP